ncbi:hypothetical protein D3C85_1919560 [compost metagenome]
MASAEDVAMIGVVFGAPVNTGESIGAFLSNSVCSPCISVIVAFSPLVTSPFAS